MARAERQGRIFQSFPRGDARGNGLLVITIAMVVAGVIFVASASEGQTALTGGTSMSLLVHDIVFAVLGLVMLVITAKIRLDVLLRFSSVLMVGALLLLTAVTKKGVTVNGGKRWLNLHVIFLQPSEIFKLATVLYVAHIIQKHHLALGRGLVLMRHMAPIAGGVLLILLEPDMGTSSMVIAIALAMLVVAGMSRKFIGITAGTLFIGLIAFINLKSYAWTRFSSFLHFGEFQNSLNYQIDQSKIAIGSGGLTGLGFGHSRAKWGLLPNPHTDFIFSILGEEMGLIGAVVVIALFAMFTIFAVRIAARCTNDAYRFVAIGITVWIALEAIINIASVVGWWAVTGIPLPFFSYGGTSLVMELIAVGILYNIANNRTTSKDLTIRERKMVHLPVALHGYREERVSPPRVTHRGPTQRPRPRY